MIKSEKFGKKYEQNANDLTNKIRSIESENKLAELKL